MMEKKGKYIIAIDTGGTFTDAVIVDMASGSTTIAKAPYNSARFFDRGDGCNCRSG